MLLYLGSQRNIKMGQMVSGIGTFLIAEFMFLISCLIFPQIITEPAHWFWF